MREVDRLMIEEALVSLVQMMENAGRNLAVLARYLVGGDVAGRRISVLAGPGGNGGGGLVAARHLVNAGAAVCVVLSRAPAETTDVPRLQHEILERMDVEIGVAPGGMRADSELVIDALLGYSQSGDPRGAAAELIRLTEGARVLSLDTPSGLELSTGDVRDPAVVADATMTLALPKEKLAGPDAAPHVGELYLADISVPQAVYQQIGRGHATPFGRSPLVRLGT